MVDWPEIVTIKSCECVDDGIILYLMNDPTCNQVVEVSEIVLRNGKRLIFNGGKDREIEVVEPIRFVNVL